LEISPSALSGSVAALIWLRWVRYRRWPVELCSAAVVNRRTLVTFRQQQRPPRPRHSRQVKRRQPVAVIITAAGSRRQNRRRRLNPRLPVAAAALASVADQLSNNAVMDY
jgi:hypothetical protein